MIFFKKVSFLFYFLFVTCMVYFCGCSTTNITIKPASKFRKEASFSFFSSYYKGFSLNTYNYLNANSLMQDYEDRPQELVQLLEERFINEKKNPALLEILANICYLQGTTTKDKDLATRYYLSAAMYSYFYFLYFDPSSSESNYDMAKFFVAHYYNRSVQEIFRYVKKKELLFRASYPLESITGHQITFTEPIFKLAYSIENFKEFLVCSDYETKHLDYFSYRPGIGVPLIARMKNEPSTNLVREISGQALPSTLMLHFRLEKDKRHCQTYFEFYDTYRQDVVILGKRHFPLEYDFSTPLAYHLSKTPDLNNFYYTIHPDKTRQIQGLYLLEPYDPNKIPVIFVHGILSNPRTWSQMTNTLKTDPNLRKNYQFWMFSYSAGWPVVFSGYLLRRSIQECYQKYHPLEQNDQKFKQMILIGHSMGGLVSKLQILDSKDGLWEKIFTPEELAHLEDQLIPKQKQVLKDMMEFKPSPYIQRIVFMATPHHGSELAKWRIVHWARKMIELPIHAVAMGQDLVGWDKKDIDSFSGIADLDPENKTLEAILSLPSKNIPLHSVIGNRKRAIPGGSDGIVSYKSSHLDQVASELVVKSGHSVHLNPLAIQEIRRILLMNLSELNLLNNYNWDFILPTGESYEISR